MRPALQLPARMGEKAHLSILTTPRLLLHVRLADHRFLLDKAAFIAWEMDDPRCPLRQWIGSLRSLQSPPLLVSRRPESPPEGVGPCAKQCARSSRRCGVGINGAKVH